jgi:sugar lactone lactonase YvrE
MKRFRKLVMVFVVALIVVAAVWWIATAPPSYLKIAPRYVMGPVPEGIAQVTAMGDPIGESLETIAPNVPGYDDVVLQEDLGRAFVTARDGWIWRVDLESGEAEPFVDVPLMASGAHVMPGDPKTLCFCASHLYGATYPEDEQAGLYRLDVETKEIEPVVLRTPIPPDVPQPAQGNEGTVYTADTEQVLAVASMNDGNSRPIAFCNDFDISADGQRFYFSEPFAYEGASMGGGATGEAITLGLNGRLWKYDAEKDEVALAAHGYNFVDGVLLENGAGGREQSVLITETTKFRIMRLRLAGERAGRDEIVWEALPSMPDGLDRDRDGRIWVGMIKQRTGFITTVHANPWLKPLLLRLPLEMLPVPTVTGVLALSPDASSALWYAEHPATRVQDIAVVVPGESHVYLANFSDERPGLHRMAYPSGLD